MDGNGIWTCPTDPSHLCGQETYDRLGFCPYCHISQEARVIYVQRLRDRKRETTAS